MQQSNTYIIVYSAVLTIILGLLLSGSAQVLGPWQQKAIELDKKKQILGAVISAEQIAAMTPEDVDAFYSSRISSTVVDITGKEITSKGVSAEKVEIAKDYKKPAEERAYPVFIYHAEGNPCLGYRHEYHRRHYLSACCRDPRFGSTNHGSESTKAVCRKENI